MHLAKARLYVVAVPGVEPGFGGYEPPVVPFHQTAHGSCYYTLREACLQAKA